MQSILQLLNSIVAFADGEDVANVALNLPPSITIGDNLFSTTRKNSIGYDFPSSLKYELDALKLPNLEKYKYNYNSVNPAQVEQDLNLLSINFTKRLQLLINEEANRTNGWSLIWKLEAALLSLDQIIGLRLQELRRKLLQNSENLDNNTENKETISNSKKAWDDFKKKYSVSDQIKLLGQLFLYPDDRKFVSEDKKVNIRTGGQFTPQMVQELDKSPSPIQQMWSFFIQTLMLIEKYIKLENKSVEIFAQMKSWLTNCSLSSIKISEEKPMVKGLDAIANRITERWIFPLLQPNIFSLKNEQLIYGPPGAGKTVLSMLVAHTLADTLMSHYLRHTKKQKNATFLLKDDFLTYYYVDMLKIRNEVRAEFEALPLQNKSTQFYGNKIIEKLKNLLNCLQVEMMQKQRKNRNKLQEVHTLSLFFLDNMDTIFLSDQELQHDNRLQSPMNLTILNEKMKTETPIPPFPGPPPFAPTILPSAPAVGGVVGANVQETKAGGGIVHDFRASLDYLELKLQELFQEDYFKLNWPHTRLLWSARQPWQLPSFWSKSFKDYQYFVDLPFAETRRSIIWNFIETELMKNLAAQMDQLEVYSDLATIVSQAGPDDDLYNIELELIRALQPEYLGYKHLVERQTVERIEHYRFVQNLISKKANLNKLLLNYKDRIGTVVEQLVMATGMSLEGECMLQNQYGLSKDIVSQFMIVTGRSSITGEGLNGILPFGFTIDQIHKMLQLIVQHVNHKNLKTGLNVSNAFIYGSDKYSADTCLIAAQKNQKNMSVGEFDLNTLNEFDKGKCAHALGPDLLDLKTGKHVLSLRYLFGSHRILLEDVNIGLQEYEKVARNSVAYKNLIRLYPQFVSYVVTGSHVLPYGTNKTKEISQKCKARPGP